MSDDQTAVLDWLADPASHPDRPSGVERIDTHSASVFLAGDRAYKAKRAVRYSFLDFSTLEKRRRACEAECRLNQRTAPRLYLGVTPVTRSESGALAIGGNGAPVEWLVVMRRFPQEQLLDRLAATGRVSVRLAERLGEQVAEFHSAATPTPHRGGVAGMRDVVEDNTRALASAAPHLDGDAVGRVTAACEQALQVHGRLLESRRAGGFVRQCHGDLHLRNIVLLEDRPTLFDAVEFNDDFACIDVWYDLAFLVMDLLARGLTVQANALFNRYLLRTSDVGGLPLLPFFLCCRAAIRAKTSMASLALESDPGRQHDWRARAREYMDLAGRLVGPALPRLVAIGGLSGSGKSTVAAELAPSLGTPPGAVVLRSDVLRKSILHRADEERLGPDEYTPDMTREVYRALFIRAADVLASGGSVIADATFLDPVMRHEAAAAATRAGVPFTGIWLDAPPDQLADRLRRRVGDASDATVEVLEEQRAGSPGEMTWPSIDSTRPAADIARGVMDRIRQP